MIEKSCLPFVVVIVAVLLAAPSVEATDCDLWTSVDGPAIVDSGELVTFTVNYGNNGPSTAETAYVNLALLSGVPARYDLMTTQQWDDLQASAAGTDTLGNVPILFGDAATCEGIGFQLQGGSPLRAPMLPLDPGVSGSFTFDLPIPPEAPTIGMMVITEPPSLARTFLPWQSENQRLHNTVGVRRMGRGAGCDQNGAGCTHFDDCLGARLSYLDPPVTADLEVVDDGSADPTTACVPLIGFTAGRVAVVRRGGCTFQIKAQNAQDAGAVGVIVVNADGTNCGGTAFPFDGDCVFNMFSETSPTGITVPTVFLSFNDGEAIITELTGGGTVSAVLGAVTSHEYELNSDSFMTGLLYADPNSGNNDDSVTLVIAIFTDDFETGDTSAWSL